MPKTIADRSIKIGQVSAAVFKLIKMRNQSWRFNRKSKIFRTPVKPISKKLNARESVKSRVEFNRIEMLTIMLKPVFLRKLLWIELAFPLFVVKTRSTDQQFHFCTAHHLYW